MNKLGAMAQKDQDFETAKMCYHRALDAGDIFARFNLDTLLESLGDTEGIRIEPI
jgi:hypothetical protein